MRRTYLCLSSFCVTMALLLALGNAVLVPAQMLRATEGHRVTVSTVAFVGLASRCPGQLLAFCDGGNGNEGSCLGLRCANATDQCDCDWNGSNRTCNCPQ